MPICVGLAFSSTKKLLNSTPPTAFEKTVAQTPSQVEAARLVRIACFSSGMDSVTGSGTDADRFTSTGRDCKFASCSKSISAACPTMRLANIWMCFVSQSLLLYPKQCFNALQSVAGRGQDLRRFPGIKLPAVSTEHGNEGGQRGFFSAPLCRPFIAADPGLKTVPGWRQSDRARNQIALAAAAPTLLP